MCISTSSPWTRPAEERGNDTPALSPLEAYTELALAGGAFLARPAPPPERHERDFERKDKRFAASCDGFDVHCAVRIAKGDDEGRERLARYCARPPFALERIELLRDGRVAYRVKTPRRGRTHRVMSPVEFLARLAVLIPPPRYPLLRYHGVFAARSAWRPLVTPKPPASARPLPCAEGKAKAERAPAVSDKPAVGDTPAASPPPTASPPPMPMPKSPASSRPSRPLPAVPASHTSLAHDEPVARADPTTITIQHWGRLLDGELLAVSTRIAWPVLMKRTFGFEIL